MNDEAMDIDELRAWLWLLRAPGVGPVSLRALLEAYGRADVALQAGRAAWARLRLSREAQNNLAQPDQAQIDQDLQWLQAEPNRHLITASDLRFPARLAEIDQAPLALFCIGDPSVLVLPQVAVVGARSATQQGLENARDFAAALCSRGLVVTSGLALGIDGAAHRGALAAKGTTIAVCATGLDRVYPARHRELAHAIAATGLLVSEFSPGMAPLAENFPRRNRLISGLSLGVLVVEAARESGSLITARLAAEQGREVFAIPGSIHNPLARGCHQLLRQGAKLVETADDIIEELAGVLSGVLRETGGAPQTTGEPGPARELQGVWQALGDDPVTPDHLAERLNLPTEAISTLLLQLELEGWARTDNVGRVMRSRSASSGSEN